MGVQRYKIGFLLGGPYTGYIGTNFIIWSTIMGSRTLLVCTYLPSGISPVQVRMMQERAHGGWKINILLVIVAIHEKVIKKERSHI